jgi:general secretion pathway protein G
LIELLVVLVIIGLLAALVAPNFIGQSEKAKPKVARTQMENLRNALDMFQLDVGRYPTTQEGLEALRVRPSSAARWSGPYLRDDLPNDPWGVPISTAAGAAATRS